jgi:2-polyprenyl-6-methoxyphenol hydroxylase-like FAD-dependent oxidoreductase
MAVETRARPEERNSEHDDRIDSPATVAETGCCIVGGGPAGVLLALLLGRAGVPVVLLEAHRDFARDFRGNTLNPATLAILDDLGLAEGVLRLPHRRVRRFTARTTAGETVFADFGRLRARYPFVALLPQADFLAFVATEAARLPGVRIVMGARVEGLIEEGNTVCGVRRVVGAAPRASASDGGA